MFQDKPIYITFRKSMFMSLSSILKYSITDLTDYENSILGDLKGYCISKSYIWLQSLNLNENATNNPGKIMSPNPIML